MMWTLLFVFNSGMRAAEVSITTLYPWKVREMAEEKGPKSPFAYVDKEMTRVLTTILVVTTCTQVSYLCLCKMKHGY
jgi:putative hemolysin